MLGTQDVGETNAGLLELGPVSEVAIPVDKGKDEETEKRLPFPTEEDDDDSEAVTRLPRVLFGKRADIEKADPDPPVPVGPNGKVGVVETVRSAVFGRRTDEGKGGLPGKPEDAAVPARPVPASQVPKNVAQNVLLLIGKGGEDDDVVRETSVTIAPDPVSPAVGP